ncbi:uracil-DNA glycosylase [Sporosarcina sp. Te-1]|uniref:uracil-DNA glycosylase n=1 Tax=Sporosarcina sp. Te-1 TaxID=2818390 RepID=UPI001FB0C452|nr:uracil-DNA glycosylase [Sporosarcina sp. Te-1]
MAVNCFKCRHFFVTWDPQHPRSCKAYGFKTRELPSIVVRRSSGMECMHFAQKRGEAGK